MFADECAAFLAGNVLEVYGTAPIVPEWAQINWIAHADPAELADGVRRAAGSRRPRGSWPRAVLAVARELVGTCRGDPGAIRLLQRECLVPMELVLLGETPVRLLPDQFVAPAVPRIRAHALGSAMGLEGGPEA